MLWTFTPWGWQLQLQREQKIFMPDGSARDVAVLVINLPPRPLRVPLLRQAPALRLFAQLSFSSLLARVRQLIMPPFLGYAGGAI